MNIINVYSNMIYSIANIYQEKNLFFHEFFNHYMQKNYIILAHKNPKQLSRLVERLNDKWTYFYIHIDKNFDIEPFRIEICLHNVSFVEKRETSTWGDIGAVLATINCLKKILQSERKGYCILLSGQDYPIKSNTTINSFLTDNYGSNFIQSLPFEEIWDINEWSDRLEKYKFNLSSQKGDFILIPWLFTKNFFQLLNIKKLIVFLYRKKNMQILHILRKREFPKNIRPYGGSQWWAFTIETVKKIVEFLEQDNGYLRYHKFTLLADEIFFHSLLDHLAKKDKGIVLKPSVTYVNWFRVNETLPVTFRSHDVTELVNLPDSILFARKFDVDLDALILDQLDDLVSYK